MANTILEFDATSGQTLTADLTQPSDTSVATGLSATEETNGNGIYQITHTGSATGHLRASVKIGSNVIGVYHFYVAADDTNTYYAIPAALAANGGYSGDSFARLGAPAGASVSADIAAIAADNPALPTKGVQLSNFVFPMIDSTNDVFAKAGLTVTSQISKDGGALASTSNSVVEISDGLYKITLSSTEMNADVVVLRFSATGANDQIVSLLTQPT